MRYSYDLGLLAEAAARTASSAAVLQELGIPVTPSRRRYVRRLLLDAGVELAHWDAASRNVHSSADLRAAVAASTSIAGVLRVLGIRQAGGSQAWIGRRIRREGLDTSHFTGQSHARGSTSPRRRSASEVLVLLPPDSARPGGARLRRALLEAGVAYLCVHCGCGPEWQGQPLTLVVDHVDGDWTDNRIHNLRFLCPNCHAQTATWCRNRGRSPMQRRTV